MDTTKTSWGRNPDAEKAPDYTRVVALLRDDELQAELDGERGTPGYRDAVRAEQARRAGWST